MISLLKSRRTPAPEDAGPQAAPAAGELVDPGVMDEIRHLELISRTVVDGLLAGKHRSTTKGGCCEFAQHRQYAPGDEIRQIDWQIYARNDRYFVRQFEEETNLHAIVALDTSGSMKFGLSTDSKLEYSRRAAACLARLLLHQRDSVGAAVLNDERPLFAPPRQNASHLQAILSVLQTAQAGGSGSLGSQVRACIPRLRRRGMFILFSDCFGDLGDLAKALRVVRARGHDVVVMQVLAPEEVHFNFRHWSSFQSLETAGQKINLDPAAIRDEYLRRIRAFLEQLEETVTGLGGDYVRITTNHSLADALGWFLRSRMARA
ncbi:hypothetical protein Mal4_23880 [Maioricimonas rarisocia]|uniref:DUF58 domain-containing protein n=1 Tax=Maioricimonas rarisocia TaxID=2528026 RepID=A0A517Z6E7_9PLAN|nr:DUF58 domain-containing protein [Maioricimonas rarisocia]QDU38068.1 hypothetical protein Mal4_23880 [Maioricimonas rarisocia]